LVLVQLGCSGAGVASGLDGFCLPLGLFIFPLWYLCSSFVPLSIGMAILRSRLFDIDIIIRRTLIYTVFTATPALVYFGSVVLLESFFRGLTSQGQNPLVTVASTLTIAALFTPLRRRVQDGIDHRFYRRMYNAA
jgi:hypothetical protein